MNDCAICWRPRVRRRATRKPAGGHGVTEIGVSATGATAGLERSKPTDAAGLPAGRRRRGSTAGRPTWSRARNWRERGHRGHRAVIPLREALILQAAINHPWLLDEHLEDISGIEFRHPDSEKLKLALIDIAAHDGGHDGAAMRAELLRRGLADQIERTEKAITTASVWGARPEAGPEDVLMTWNQLIALHRQWHSLT